MYKALMERQTGAMEIPRGSRAFVMWEAEKASSQKMTSQLRAKGSRGWWVGGWGIWDLGKEGSNMCID